LQNFAVMRAALSTELELRLAQGEFTERDLHGRFEKWHGLNVPLWLPI
jgi:hypothetical protein